MTRSKSMRVEDVKESMESVVQGEEEEEELAVDSKMVFCTIATKVSK